VISRLEKSGNLTTDIPVGTLIVVVFTVCAVATDCIVFGRVFVSVNTITHEPLHSAR